MQPNIDVGILSAPKLNFTLNGGYRLKHTGEIFTAAGMASVEKGDFDLRLSNTVIRAILPLELEPVDYEKSFFELEDVIIGIDFHWERKENQHFKGTLRVIEENGQLTAINRLPLEDYLVSVISSEMSANSSPQLLRAHAVISRSWLLAQKEKEQKLKEAGSYQTTIESPGEKIRWYDREDHLNFDVCADDHCQRYQGITRATVPEVEKAVTDTSGEILVYDGKIADARFSKCCGGITETFENVWEPIPHPYLVKVIDNEVLPAGYNLELSNEEAAAAWITGTPPAYCNTQDKTILNQVLNDYDQETADFFRWRVTLTQGELKAKLKKKIGLDLGDITDLVPVERGVSGRLIKLRIVGSKGSQVIGKELEIRKALSDSHLYSSAFIVEKQAGSHNIPGSFTLHGAGWGHGVGLCQIGAAVMGAKGYSYQQILEHYFRGALPERRY